MYTVYSYVLVQTYVTYFMKEWKFNKTLYHVLILFQTNIIICHDLIRTYQRIKSKILPNNNKRRVIR